MPGYGEGNIRRRTQSTGDPPGSRWSGFRAVRSYVTGTAELRVQDRSRVIVEDVQSALFVDGGQRILWQLEV